MPILGFSRGCPDIRFTEDGEIRPVSTGESRESTPPFAGTAVIRDTVIIAALAVMGFAVSPLSDLRERDSFDRRYRWDQPESRHSGKRDRCKVCSPGGLTK